MSLKALKFALVGCLALVVASSASAATVTVSAVPNQIRTGTGAGTWTAYDFYLTMGGTGQGFELLNYRLIANATSGTFIDTNRAQDDRQTMPQTGTANEHIDTFANTVWRAVGKDDLGLGPLTPTSNAGSYVPSGTGASAPFAFLDWSVNDVPALAGDDNNVSDDVVTNDGSPRPTAPYHVARILAQPAAQGTFQVRIFEGDSTPGVSQDFNFTFGVVPNTPPQIVDYVEPNPIHASIPGSYAHQMTVIDPDAGDPQGSHTWSGLALQSYTPNFGGENAPNTPPPNAAALSASGNFSWNTVGAARGTYVWSMSASDGDASDSGTITLNVNAVPEPATVAMLGLAMLGMVGVIRRR